MLVAPRLEAEQETQRVQALQRMRLLDTPPDERFDSITQLACQLFNVPIALLSLIDRNRLWLKSHCGLGVSEIPRDISICGHVILQDDVFVVHDTLQDPRFFDCQLVTGEPHIRFYAGYPLRAPSNHKIGTLCVIDSQPRKFSADQRELLRNVAQRAQHQLLDLVRATVDEVTHVVNYGGFRQLATQALAAAGQTGHDSVLLVLNLNTLSIIKDHYGRDAGNMALLQFATCLTQSCRQFDIAGRLDDDRFAVFMPDASPDSARALVRDLIGRIAQLDAAGLLPMSLRFSVGLATAKPAVDHDLDTLLLEADAQLLANKRRQ